MNQLHKWLAKQEQVQHKFVSIYDAFFANKMDDYILFRLRFYNLNILWGFFISLLLFYYFFNSEHFSTFVMLAVIFYFQNFMMNFWWGFIEDFREKIRLAYKKGTKDQLEGIISDWLKISATVALVIVLISLLILYQHFKDSYSIETRETLLFASIMTFIFALKVLLSTYQSGIYAITRILRPPISLILADIIALAVMILLWEYFTVYQLILISYTLREMIALYIRYYYARRMYNLYDICPSFTSWKIKENIRIKFFIPGLANALCYMEAFLLIVWIVAQLRIFPMETGLLLDLLLITPFLNAAATWSFLFYFDRKKLNNQTYKRFLKIFNDKIQKSCAFWSVIYWLISLISSYVLISTDAAFFTILLFPFYIMMAIIANQQRKAFAECDYKKIIYSGILMLINFFTVFFVIPVSAFSFLFILLGLVAIYFYLKNTKTDNLVKNEMEYLNPFQWLQKLNQQVFSTAFIFRIEFIEKTGHRQLNKIIDNIKRKGFFENDNLCMINGKTVLCYILNKDADFNLKKQVFIEGAGFIKKYEENCLTKEEIRIKILQKPIFRDIIYERQTVDDVNNVHPTVCKKFLEYFPNGCYYDPHCHLGPVAKPVSNIMARKIPYLLHQTLYLNNEKNTNLDVTALYFKNTIMVVFVVPILHRSAEFMTKLKTWRKYLTSLNATLNFYE